MDITLRPADKSDIEFARRAHHLAYRDVVMRQFGSWDEATQDAFFITGWNQENTQIVLCNGTPCGYVQFERGESEIRGQELVLLPDFQNKGVGTHLLQSVMQDAASQRISIILHVLNENRALALYHKLGFVEVGNTETHKVMRWPAP